MVEIASFLLSFFENFLPISNIKLSTFLINQFTIMSSKIFSVVFG